MKMDFLRKRFIKGNYICNRLAKEIQVSTGTTWRYKKEFERIQKAFPGKLADMNFYMPEPEEHKPTPLYAEFIRLLPGLLSAEKPGVTSRAVWRKYRLINPYGYKYLPFTRLFFEWIAVNDVPRKPPLLDQITESDLKTLRRWRLSNDRRKWQIAVTLDMASKTSLGKDIVTKIETTYQTLAKWLVIYRSKGLAGFEPSKREVPGNVVKRMNDHHVKLVKLLHESPKSHGLNRTSWTITALSEIYSKLYKTPISWGQVSYCLKKNGYQFKKSRDVLTSQDPKFREKIKKIQRTLQRLGPDEKFFSIDEYGPVGIRIRGGRMIKGLKDSYDVPDKQRNKGVIICTAALELSRNQVTYFYS